MTEETHVEVDQLLENIRSQFYTELPAKRFHQDRTILLLAITWPATWLKHRGVTWTAENYFQKMRDLLNEIKRHGDTVAIRFFPRYLLKCIQDHFAHNSDQICDEGKKTRNAFENALLKASAANRIGEIRAAENLVDTLALAHRVLATRQRPAKAPKTDDLQPTLFDV